jgi:hypothetical protein
MELFHRMSFSTGRTVTGTLAQSRADLAQQMEELLVSVWECEKEWDFDNRIDSAIRYGR